MPAFDDRMSFVSDFVVCREGGTRLPFSVGGVTNHGWHGQPQNNQDAMAVWVDEDLIVCVVSDGCGSAASSSANVMSMNEVGSRLTCLAALGAARRLVSQGVPLGGGFVGGVEAGIHRMIRQVVNLGGAASGSLRNELLFNFVMSTALVAVITPRQYLVMACGDGCVRVNGVNHDLSHMSGLYLANSHSTSGAQRRRGAMRQPKGAARASVAPPQPQSWFDVKETSSLSSLSLATDGASELFSGCEDVLERLEVCDVDSEYTAGYDAMFFREFRRRAAAGLPASSVNQVHDDRTLLLVRRISGVTADADGQVEPRTPPSESVPASVRVHVEVNAAADRIGGNDANSPRDHRTLAAGAADAITAAERIAATDATAPNDPLAPADEGILRATSAKVDVDAPADRIAGNLANAPGDHRTLEVVDAEAITAERTAAIEAAAPNDPLAPADEGIPRSTSAKADQNETIEDPPETRGKGVDDASDIER